MNEKRETENGKRKTEIGRRKFFIFSGLGAIALSLLRNLRKSPKIALRDLRVSIHPAQFYKKLYSKDE
jgi:hypothetical protein